MPTARLLKHDLLDPISPDNPAGTDLRWTPEWDRIREARRADDTLQAGKWVKKEQKSADWKVVSELATLMLRTLSKDLQLAMWLTEANLELRGFAGLGDGLGLSRELILRYWDAGLHPMIEDGPEDRAGPLRWLDDKLVDSILAIPITFRSNGERDFSVLDLREARRVGSEANTRDENGDVDPKKKREYDAAIAAGRPSMEMFARAVRETPRAVYEKLFSDFDFTHKEFRALERTVDEKFGEGVVTLSACRNVFREIEQEILKNLEQKRREEPDVAPQEAGSSGLASSPGNVLKLGALSVRTFTPLAQVSVDGGKWEEAEQLVRADQVDRGLAEMTRLAAAETSGRSRFHRKLLLAEVCMGRQQERLARTILEELAVQIDKYQLDSWEASDLVARVWVRLYEIYKHGNPSDADRASLLYERLCRLDPWQALACSQ